MKAVQLAGTRWSGQLLAGPSIRSLSARCTIRRRSTRSTSSQRSARNSPG